MVHKNLDQTSKNDRNAVEIHESDDSIHNKCVQSLYSVKPKWNWWGAWAWMGTHETSANKSYNYVNDNGNQKNDGREVWEEKKKMKR